MKIFYLYSVFLPILCFSQVSDTVFYNIYGGPNQEEARDFIETSDKGFLICGSSSSFGQGASSIYVIKTDSNGVFKWSKTYGGINADRGMSIVKTSTNGAFICGYSNSFNNFEYDIFYLKIDSLGNIIWQKTFVENDWEFAYSSILLENDELIIAGETYSNTNGNSDGLLIKINSSGDVVWSKKFGFENQDAFLSVAYNNGFIYAAGFYTNSLNQLPRGLIYKCTTDGIPVDTLLFTANNNLIYKFNSINFFDNNSLILTGEVVSSDSLLPQTDIFLKTDTTLSILIRDTSQFSSIKKGEYAFKHNGNGKLMTISTLTGGNGKTAMFLANFDISNNQLIYHFGSTYGGLEEEQGVKGLLSSRNKLVYLGNTKSWGFGDQDFWLVMFKGDSLTSDHKIKNRFYTDTTSLSPLSFKKINKNNFIVYPNPLSKNEKLNLINLTQNENHLFELYNKLGDLIISKSVENNEKVDLSTLNLKSGLYFITVKSKNEIFHVPILINDF